MSELSELLEEKNASFVGYSFGHPIYFDGEDWRYADGTIKNEETRQNKKCPHCGKTPTEGGHDPCIKSLPAVENACCGHGKEKGYIAFEDGRVIRGYFAMIEDGTEVETLFDVTENTELSERV